MILAAAAGSITAGGSLIPYLSASHNQKVIGDFVLSANPSSMSIPQGASSVSTITVTSLDGFTGTVSLSTMFTSGSLPVTLSSSAVSVPANGEVTSTLNVTVPSNATIGSYGIVVVGTSATPKKVLSSSTSVSVQVTGPADFSLSAQPYSFVEVAGEANSSTIVVTGLNGFNGNVSLSVTAPFGFIGVMGGTNPVVLSSSGMGYASLRISTTTSTLPGTYDITVTGTSGLESHSCTVVVYVVDPPVESLTLTGYVFSSSTNLTLYLQNTGNTTVSLDWYDVKDFAGDAYTLSNWTGPTIASGSTVAVNILIGSSCSACTYTWVIGLYTQFVQGQTYTVDVMSTTTNEFTFNVTY